MTLIIGFGNKARHGKDTAGESIVNYFERRNKNLSSRYGQALFPVVNAKHYKFAEALYEECRTVHGMTEKDPVLLQHVGMARRAEDPDYWVKKVAARIEAEKPDIAVITDVRFKNEAKFIQIDKGGVVVNVSRLNADGSPFVSGDRPADHPSEIELDGWRWDYFLKAHTGESAWIEQQAVCLVEYERALRSK